MDISPLKTIVLVHGGPGGAGELHPMALRLSASFEVVESLQSRYTIAELVDELHDDVLAARAGTVTLLGHSWGAWLALLYAARHAGTIDNLILVGCPPLEERYVPRILENRLRNLSATDADALSSVIRALERAPNESLMHELRRLTHLGDNYDVEEYAGNTHVDARMYDSVWSEAAELRKRGCLLDVASRVSCPLHIIHGDRDPHPIEGVTEPLDVLNIGYTLYILPRCGHAPFAEREARDEFYEVIMKIKSANLLTRP
ncbi:MAG: alpha/beta hydrolase [Mediterranea sp.]|nr:alpha/beta hydrolase [Mediterranea sp.]